MTNSQRLSVELSETRQALNGEIEKRNKLTDGQEPSAEDDRKLDELTRKVSRLETEYRAAVTTEAAEAEEQRSTEPDAEKREELELLGRASIGPYLMEAVEQRSAGGVEAELRAAALGDDANPGSFPVELLDFEAPARTEERADAVTPVAAAALADGSQASVLPRVFTRSVASRLGVAMPTVPVGAAVYPVMLTGTTATQAADDTHVDAAAGSFTGYTLEPIRLTAAYLYRTRQALQLRNFEEVLRRDLNAVMSDAMDDQVVNGDGAGANVNGFLSELPAAADAVDAEVNYRGYIGRLAQSVDGINAYGMADLRTVIGAATFRHMIDEYRSNNSEQSAWDKLMQTLGGISVTSRIPAPTNDVQTNVTALSSYPGRNAVAPVWRGVELIRDPYTAAGRGEVRLTAIMYWNFKILREAGWKLWRAKLA